MALLLNEAGTLCAAAGRIDELLRAPSPVLAPARPVAASVGGEVVFDGVHFGYLPDRPVLRGVSFTVRPGETIALVGASGVGTSMCAHLLLRFHDPSTERITVGGVDARAAPHRHPGPPGRPPAHTVPRRATGRPLRTGRRATLSGGQRARVAIARALFTGAPVLVLDEAVANAALEATGDHRATLVIAHRLATIMRADRVSVLDGGLVVADAAPEQLRRRGARTAAVRGDGATTVG